MTPTLTPPASAPASATPSTPLTLDQVFRAVADLRELHIQKVRDGIKFKLRKTISRDEAEELVSEVTTDLVVRAHAGKVSFPSAAGVTGYVLLTAWRTYRDAHIGAGGSKARQAHALRGQERQDEVFADEAYQTHARPQGGRRGKGRVMTSLDALLDAPGGSPALEARLAAHHEPARTATDQDLTDAYYLELYRRLFQYLEDCIADQYLSFREVGIYKQYVINGYTMKEVVAHSDFSRTICYDAIHKIKAHLATVDWYLAPRPRA